MGCYNYYYYINNHFCSFTKNTFVKKENNKNYCIDYYKNCATCKDIGNQSEMKCELYPDYHIKYSKNYF